MAAAAADDIRQQCARTAAREAVRRKSKDVLAPSQTVPPCRVAVVLPAGGSGTRAGLPTPKQVYRTSVVYKASVLIWRLNQSGSKNEYWYLSTSSQNEGKLGVVS